MVDHAVEALAARTDSCCSIREGMKGEASLRRIQRLYAMKSTTAAEALVDQAMESFEEQGGDLAGFD